ncbi:hypothetical protein [Escherichia coli]|uniref:hypothetical protein n=1 Tax=Escherichia coli TaxID=562 RepID=UPI0025735598|nr:hypothetical protein [Escherichia coli]EJW1274591.1 hypothetical protein [Escherichia coli]BDW71995.1 hypothetical protein JNE151685_46720 [Escherichia coli]
MSRIWAHFNIDGRDCSQTGQPSPERLLFIVGRQYGASVDAYALTSNALVGLSTDATSQEKFGADRKITDKNDDA